MFGSAKKKAPAHHRKKSSGQYYFVAHNPGHSESVRDADDNVDVIELKGADSVEEEYRPKPVNRNLVSWSSCVESSRDESKSFGRTTWNESFILYKLRWMKMLHRSWCETFFQLGTIVDACVGLILDSVSFLVRIISGQGNVTPETITERAKWSQNEFSAKCSFQNVVCHFWRK